MVEDRLEWFGAGSPLTTVQVHGAAGPTRVPDVVSFGRAAAGTRIRGAELAPVFTGAVGSLTEVALQTPDGRTIADRRTEVTLTMARVGIG